MDIIGEGSEPLAWLCIVGELHHAWLMQKALPLYWYWRLRRHMIQIHIIFPLRSHEINSCLNWRKKERKKDILTSSKAKFGLWDKWFTKKWDIYPCIESKNKIKIEFKLNSSKKITNMFYIKNMLYNENVLN